MATTIIVAAIGGFVLLFFATMALVALNWSEKTLTPVLSIFLIGTATTLAAVIVSLKPTTMESVFPTSVVLDVVDGAPPFIIPDQSSPDVTSRLSELSRLGRPAVTRDGKTVITVEKPTNENERFKYCGELLQYQLAYVIAKLQRGSSTAGMKFGASFAVIKKPMKLSKIQDYPGKTFLDAVAVNRFSNSDFERFGWDHGHLPLPKSTHMSLIHVESSPETGLEKHIVRLAKPLFFTIDFVVEPLLGTGAGFLPKGLALPPEAAARCQTYQFQVTMHADFDRITAGNEQTSEYKDWANWLFSNVRDSIGD